MTVNRSPTSDELNGKNQDVVHWPAKAYRVTLIDSDGNEFDSDYPLYVRKAIQRKTGTITVSGGTGTVTLTDVNINALVLAVKSPGSTDAFKVAYVDTDSGVEIKYNIARSTDRGVARSDTNSIPLFDLTINITEADADGDYVYLLLGN